MFVDRVFIHSLLPLTSLTSSFRAVRHPRHRIVTSRRNRLWVCALRPDEFGHRAGVPTGPHDPGTQMILSFIVCRDAGMDFNLHTRNSIICNLLASCGKLNQPAPELTLKCSYAHTFACGGNYFEGKKKYLSIHMKSHFPLFFLLY